MCVLILLYQKSKPNFQQCCSGLTDYRLRIEWNGYFDNFFGYSLWFPLLPDSFCPSFPYVVAMGCNWSHIQLTSYFIILLSFNLKMTFGDGNVLPQIGTPPSCSCAFDLIVSNRMNLYYKRHLDSNTTRCRYNAVQYTMLSHTVLQWQKENISRHITSRASYRVFVVGIWGKYV